tara:strand:+ start:69 stop:350 length:282 start_codon:yes stop_codon:yes gene_type:complete
MAHYGKSEYWEDRYDKDREQYDWYQKYSGCKDCITQYITRDTSILMFGCGNAKLSEEMHLDGFKSIENIDISAGVIAQQQERYAEKIKEMKWT